MSRNGGSCCTIRPRWWACGHTAHTSRRQRRRRRHHPRRRGGKGAGARPPPPPLPRRQQRRPKQPQPWRRRRCPRRWYWERWRWRQRWRWLRQRGGGSTGNGAATDGWRHGRVEGGHRGRQWQLAPGRLAEKSAAEREEGGLGGGGKCEGGGRPRSAGEQAAATAKGKRRLGGEPEKASGRDPSLPPRREPPTFGQGDEGGS